MDAAGVAEERQRGVDTADEGIRRAAVEDLGFHDHITNQLVRDINGDVAGRTDAFVGRAGSLKGAEDADDIVEILVTEFAGTHGAYREAHDRLSKPFSVEVCHGLPFLWVYLLIDVCQR